MCVHVHMGLVVSNIAILTCSQRLEHSITVCVHVHIGMENSTMHVSTCSQGLEMSTTIISTCSQGLEISTIISICTQEVDISIKVYGHVHIGLENLDRMYVHVHRRLEVLNIAIVVCYQAFRDLD